MPRDVLQHPYVLNMSVSVPFYNTASIAYPFYGNEGQLYGLVYYHSDTEGHEEISQEAQRRPQDPHLPSVRAAFGEDGQLRDVTVMQLVMGLHLWGDAER